MNPYFPPPPTLPAGSKVWTYVRSTTDQQDGTAGQQAEIERFCQQYGLALTHVFADHGSSAADRPALREMLEKCTNTALRPGGLLIWASHRLARNLKEALQIQRRLQRSGVIVHSLTDAVITGETFDAIIDIWQEEAREQAQHDVRQAMQALFAQGYSFGMPPRGYLREQVTLELATGIRNVSRWVPDPEIWDLVKQAWQLRAEGLGYAEIQAATKDLIYQSRKNWTAFFRNKAYLGVGVWGELEIPNHHPAAIDQATWDAVQKHHKT
ncbi:MAG: recombinase family protein [Chloroflexota bacterium]